MAQRRTDKGAIESHLGHTRTVVMAALADIMGDPRRQELLQSRKNTGCHHLGAQRIRLQLSEIELPVIQPNVSI